MRNRPRAQHILPLLLYHQKPPTGLSDTEQYSDYHASRHWCYTVHHERRVLQTLWTADTQPSLLPYSAQLSTYTGQKISVLGAINVDVSYQQHHQLQLLTVPGTGPTLLGRDWLQHICLDWARINLLQSKPVIRLSNGFTKPFHQNRGENIEAIGEKTWQSCSVLHLGRAMAIEALLFLKAVAISIT